MDFLSRNFTWTQSLCGHIICQVPDTNTLILFVKIQRQNLFVLEFSEDTTSVERLKKYCVLIGQGVLAGLNMMCSYLGVLYIPLWDAMTIIYTAPIFTMIFIDLFVHFFTDKTRFLENIFKPSYFDKMA